ncbi:DUF302 domain-containing protein [Rhodothermus profundi]|uniref:Uncharacterized conserved protein, DUF302 family n=1 Tax=Rhodothermus profundi TaxID=633813 RepID=A0A1M6SSG8_9BACT|nr:DUF302 domain-containing protein [Rhodothermus profundi]SHK47629.1 Uncharacterized conserved protein, DUF302 family [Rhodothermus profundi]
MSEVKTTYYFARTLPIGLEEAEARVRELLQEEGFGVLTEIDVRETLKKKLNIEVRPYRILGACNPHFAHQALQAEPHIGTMLPCNVIVRQTEDGQTEVAAIDPVASMQAVDNPALRPIAEQVRERLKRIIEKL